MGMDEDNDDGLGGRSRDRRELTAANRWGRPLCALSEAQLLAAPLPEEIREAVRLGRELAAGTSRAFRARDRQYDRIDKLVRCLEEPEIEAIDQFLQAPSDGREQLGRWADRLIAEGDWALQEWMDEHPASDRQQLRNLVRQARQRPESRAALVDALAVGALGG
jgi:ribosome-associated protein